MGTVNKSDLIRHVAESAELTSKQAQCAVDSLFDAVTSRAERGDTIRLAGFGSFSVKARSARTARNPATGEAVLVPETRRLVFKASKKS